MKCDRVSTTRFVAAVIPALLGSSAFVEAAAIPIAAQADAGIYMQSKDNNYGGSYRLMMRNNSSSAWKAYLRFSLDGVPDLDQVQEVSLNLTSVDSQLTTTVAWSGATFHVYGLKDSAWGEGTGPNGGTADTSGATITWNNAPGNDGTSTGFSATHLGDFVTTQTGMYSFSSTSLTSFLRDVPQPTNSVTLMLSTEGGTIQYLASRSASTTSWRPQLMVTVPEPAALALMGLSLGMLCVRRRRA